jgi:myosin heavy subunit
MMDEEYVNIFPTNLAIQEIKILQNENALLKKISEANTLCHKMFDIILIEKGNLQKENDDLKIKMKHTMEKMSSTNDILKKENDNCKMEIQQLKDFFVIKNDYSMQEQLEMEHLKKENDDIIMEMKRTIEKIDNANNNLKKENDNFKMEMQELKECLDKKNEYSIQEQLEMEGLKKENDNFKMEMRQLKECLDKKNEYLIQEQFEKEGLKKENDNFKMEMQELKECLDKKNEQSMQKQLETERLKKENDDLKKQNHEFKMELQQFNGRLVQEDLEKKYLANQQLVKENLKKQLENEYPTIITKPFLTYTYNGAICRVKIISRSDTVIELINIDNNIKIVVNKSKLAQHMVSPAKILTANDMLRHIISNYNKEQYMKTQNFYNAMWNTCSHILGSGCTKLNTSYLDWKNVDKQYIYFLTSTSAKINMPQTEIIKIFKFFFAIVGEDGDDAYIKWLGGSGSIYNHYFDIIRNLPLTIDQDIIDCFINT